MKPALLPASLPPCCQAGRACHNGKVDLSLQALEANLEAMAAYMDRLKLEELAAAFRCGGEGGAAAARCHLPGSGVLVLLCSRNAHMNSSSNGRGRKIPVIFAGLGVFLRSTHVRLPPAHAPDLITLLPAGAQERP